MSIEFYSHCPRCGQNLFVDGDGCSKCGWPKAPTESKAEENYLSACTHYRCDHGGREEFDECGNLGCGCKKFIEPAEPPQPSVQPMEIKLTPVEKMVSHGDRIHFAHEKCGECVEPSVQEPIGMRHWWEQYWVENRSGEAPTGDIGCGEAFLFASWFAAKSKEFEAEYFHEPSVQGQQDDGSWELDGMVRDFCAVGPRPKWEVKRRILEYAAKSAPSITSARIAEIAEKHFVVGSIQGRGIGTRHFENAVVEALREAGVRVE